MPEFVDQVILVDEHDHQIGVMDKMDAHRNGARLHRAISVFLYNENGELLIQQRSMKKIVGAGQWANTCCGNVRPGERYEDCARRRLREELGILDVQIAPGQKFQYFAECNEEFSEREIDQVFIGKYNGKVLPNPNEVQAIDYKSISDIKKDIIDKESLYAPWFRIMVEKGVYAI